jgi:histidinol-phosphate aminotransferase
MAVDWLTQAVSQSKKLHPYIPGKPIAQMLRELGLSESEIAQKEASTVKLASNENPYSAPPQALAAIQSALHDAHRYPDGDCFELKQALALKHDIHPEQLLIGNGSNEVLELIIRTFAGVGDEVIYSQRGFIVYALATTAAGATGVAVSESDGYAHDLHAMLDAVNERTKVVCIANPNNPTGALLSTQALQSFLDKLPAHIVVILDEAYVEYVKHEVDDSIHALKHEGLIVSRTFSKAYGLAGLRVGYAVASAVLLAVVNRFREPFNVNSLAQAAALGALQDDAWVMAKVETCKQERAKLEKALLALNMLAAPSLANFVLLKYENAADLVKGLEQEGVIVRPLAPYGMPDVLRVSVGTKDENDAFLNALVKVLP